MKSDKINLNPCSSTYTKEDNIQTLLRTMSLEQYFLAKFYKCRKKVVKLQHTHNK